MIKKVSIILVLLVSFSIKGQDINLESYKYIIVSNKFNFLSEVNQYKTSSLTKFLLKKKGFMVFLDNEVYPKDLINNGCLALKAEVIDKSDFFKVKSIIQIRDCYNRVVYTSKIGKTKEKKYKKAYLLSIRNAYNSMTDFKYSYKESPTNPTKKAQKLVKKAVSKATNTPKEKAIKTVKLKKKETKKEVVKKNNIIALYAQRIENGYQLVNTKPEVVFQILKTNNKNIFIVKNKYGILYKTAQNWVVEYYKNGQLVSEKYQIKF